MNNEPNQNPPQYPPSYPPPPSYGGYGPPSQYGGYAPAPQPYAGYPAYPGPMPVSTSGWAIASLVCSLIGVSILGIIFGYIARKEIRESGGRIGGDALALVGIILGWISLAVVGLIFLFYLAVIIFAIASPSSYSFSLL